MHLRYRLFRPWPVAVDALTHGVVVVSRLRFLPLPAFAPRSSARLALTWAAGYTRPRMGTDAIPPSRRLALAQRVRSPLALTWAAGYTRPRMVTDAIHPSCRLALPDNPTTRQPDNPTTRQPDNPTTRQPDNPTTRQPDNPTTRQPDNPTTRQPDNPTTRQPDNPTTRQPDNPTTRQPDNRASLASRSGNRAAADHSAPVLSAPSIRVAHTRHASARPTADEVGPELHQSTPARVATPAGSHTQMGAASDRPPRGVGRHAQVKGGMR